ncbi:MAG: hypothetical protein IT442_00610, partial [Phycisphaeraceae bacterium]|nr:hypothetical protein [Phycisphaeraceae bacterium]
MPPLFSRPADRRFAVAVSQLMYANPFLTERIDLEHQALGEDFADVRPVWSLEAGEAFERPNLKLLHDRAESLVQPASKQLAAGSSASDADLRLYEDLAIYCLFERYRVRLRELTLRDAPTDRRTTLPAPFWPAFDADFNALFHPAGRTLPSDHQAPHLFAYFWQVQRAFTHIFHFLVGGSMPLA